MRKLILLLALMCVVGLPTIYCFDIDTTYITTPYLQPIVINYEVTDVYEWNTEINNFDSVISERKGEHRTITISPDSSHVEIKLFIGNEITIINTEVVTKIYVPDEEGDYTAMFLMDEENYPYLLESRNITGSSAFYMKYDSVNTGYNGFLGAESLKVIK